MLYLSKYNIRLVTAFRAAVRTVQLTYSEQYHKKMKNELQQLRFANILPGSLSDSISAPSC